MSDVVALVEISHSAAHWSVEQMLAAELAEVKAGGRPTKKAIVIYVNTEGGGFSPSYTQAGLRTSEGIAAIELVKARLVQTLLAG